MQKDYGHDRKKMEESGNSANKIDTGKKGKE